MLAGQEGGAVGGCLGSLPRCAEPSPPQLPLGHSLVDPFCCPFILWPESQWEVNVPKKVLSECTSRWLSPPLPRRNRQHQGEGEEREGAPERC